VDNIMDNLSELLGGMSGEDMDALRSMAQSMLGGMNLGGEPHDEPHSGEKTSEQSDSAGGANSHAPPGNSDASPFSGITPEMLLKISSLMSAMGKNDQRSDLIMALKPHLSHERQKKADDAVQMLKLMSLLPMLQGEGGLGGLFG